MSTGPSEKKLLHTAGTISAKQALDKATQEYEKYRHDQDRHYISDFDRAAKKLFSEQKKSRKA
jgi:hypothetical protein